MLNNKNRQKFIGFLLIYLILFLCWAVFSYVFTDPNLTLINQPMIINWQNFLWQKILPNHLLRIIIYLILTTALIINYFYLIKFWPKKTIFSNKKIVLLLILIVLLLLLSYNALSHDVFNYMFNARMLVKYSVNPHRVVALTFANDPWIRFMNNTHTAAPYGEVWSGISTIPYFFGFGKFIFTWLNFKIFAFLGLLISAFILNKLLIKDSQKNYRLAILLLNPLILIETLSSAHNDWWMMWPILLGFLLTKKFIKEGKKNFLLLCLIIVLILFSIFIKYTSLLIIPFFLYLFLENKIKNLSMAKNAWFVKARNFINYYFWDLMSIAFFVPLITARSQRFLTWYLIWPMAFLPLLKSKWWRNCLVIFSYSALFSYLPDIIYVTWLFFDRDLPNLLLYKQIILWLPAVTYSLYFLYNVIRKNVKTKR